MIKLIGERGSRLSKLFVAGLIALASAVGACSLSDGGSDSTASPTIDSPLAPVASRSTVIGAPTPDYRTPFPPNNFPEGECRDPVFDLIEYPSPDRVFHAGESMTATIRYDAPNCRELRATFGIRHVEGSPRFEFYCRMTDGSIPEHCADDGFNGNVPIDPILLTETAGVVTITARPGVFPPTNLESDPDLEGARVCSVILSVNDGVDGGSRSSQQWNIGCPEGHYGPFPRSHPFAPRMRER